MIRAALNVHETHVQYGESCRALIETLLEKIRRVCPKNKIQKNYGLELEMVPKPAHSVESRVNKLYQVDHRPKTSTFCLHKVQLWPIFFAAIFPQIWLYSSPIVPNVFPKKNSFFYHWIISNRHEPKTKNYCNIPYTHGDKDSQPL
jgi:hypothetical protein